MDYINIDLQLFADGGDGGATGAADAGVDTAASAAEGQNRADDRRVASGRRGRKENPLANVRYGVQREEPAQQKAPAQQAAQTEVAEQEGQEEHAETFEDLIKGKYKADYDQRVQATIRDRLKGSNERMNKLNPIIEAVAQRYGMDTSDLDKLDLDALSQKIAGDTSQYEKESLETGIPAETIAKVKRLEQIEAQQARDAKAAREQAAIEQHYNSLMQQGEQLKALYPGFNLDAELQNPAFVRLTAPGVGVDVRTAYEVVHREEMRGAEMQFAAQKSAQKIAASVQANARRPAENGMSGSTGAVTKSDPSTLTKADRAEIKRRVARGEKIYF